MFACTFWILESSPAMRRWDGLVVAGGYRSHTCSTWWWWRVSRLPFIYFSLPDRVTADKPEQTGVTIIVYTCFIVILKQKTRI